MKKITIKIDGKTIKAENGMTILEAALNNGIYVPHLCHHPDLKPTGDCGICMVDVEGADEFPKSCTTPVANGMVIQTKTQEIQLLRLEIINKLMDNHPPECMTCPQYLNCEFLSVRYYVGIGHFREPVLSKPASKSADPSNPLFIHDQTRCIKCGRCVRACNDLRGVGVLQFIGEGEDRIVGIPDNKTFADAGCRFCGACVEVCPTGSMRDRQELVAEKPLRDALIPCVDGCPGHTNVPLYVRLIREGKYSEAVAVIREKLPFPAVLGRICNHLCETNCRRGLINEAISIRELKRYAAENDYEQIWKQYHIKREPTGKKVAVVGSGPAGLAAAYDLTLMGHAAVVFEAMPEAGGMMRYGIPTYRLPREILDNEIGELVAQGVEIKTDVRIDSLEDLKNQQGFDAILVANGTHRGVKLPIPGADLEGVQIGLEFLRDVHSGRSVEIGDKVVVLGGGNVAFDCARVARRAGGKDIHIVCLEPADAMLADKEEIEQGKAEGISIHPARTFTRIVKQDDNSLGVECLNINAFKLNENGSVQIDSVTGSEHIFNADTVIFAIGQAPMQPRVFGLKTTGPGYIESDSETNLSSEPAVFAAGDIVTRGGSVIEAIASGKKSAMAINEFLGGEAYIQKGISDKYESCLKPIEEFSDMKRSKLVYACDPKDLAGCSEAHLSLSREEATEEAARCLQCDLRFNITPVKFWSEY